MSKTFSIKTLGCKLNQYESSEIIKSLTSKGWVQKPFGEYVDIVLVNTCTVTDKSDKKCFSYIKQGAKFSRIKGTIVTGCMTENSSIPLESIHEIKGVIHNKDQINISEIIDDICKSENLDFITTKSVPRIEKKINLPHRSRQNLKIQDGCDGECTYCIIPSVRGNPVSRDFNEIILEAKELVSRGVPEIVLTGITIGRYDCDKKNLSQIVREIISIDGDFRVRITSIEPHHVDDEMISLLGHEKVCSHIHLPLQSGSDKILKQMNRPYSADKFKSVVEKIKNSYNDFAIGTDIIIGFPGEDRNDFNDSLEMIKFAEFSYVHQFTFSSREGTPAAKMKQNSNNNEIYLRTQEMKSLAHDVSLNYRKRFMGREILSVIEGREGGEKFTATTDNYLRIELENSLLNEKYLGTLQKVNIIDTGKNRNFGKIVL